MTALREFQTDVIPTSAGDLKITFLGHGSLLFEFQNKYYYVDPYSEVADYSRLPPADVVLICHEHSDHLDPVALAAIVRPGTTVIVNETGLSQVKGGTVMRNGEARIVGGVEVEAVPAYNVLHLRPTGRPYHPKGDGNGYVITFGDQRVYVAGDTEDVLEMTALGEVDVAFLPVNLPYTMSVEMAARAARVIGPRIFYPYHFGDTDLDKLAALLADAPGIEMRVRKMV